MLEKDVGTRKVVINACYGDFSLSERAIERLRELGLTEDELHFDGISIERDDPRLVQVVEELAASGQCSDLKIVEIPADAEWEIHHYDGKEWIAEPHRTWS